MPVPNLYAMPTLCCAAWYVVLRRMVALGRDFQHALDAALPTALHTALCSRVQCTSWHAASQYATEQQRVQRSPSPTRFCAHASHVVATHNAFRVMLAWIALQICLCAAQCARWHVAPQ